MNYFDFLPEEMLAVILYDVDSTRDLITLSDLHRSFKNILQNELFWSTKIRLTFPNLDFRVVPDYLWKYKDKELYTILANYRRLYEIYENVIRTFININIELDYKLQVLNMTIAREHNKSGFNVNLEEQLNTEIKYDLHYITNFDLLSLSYTTGLDEKIKLELFKYFITAGDDYSTEQRASHYILIHISYFGTYKFAIESVPHHRRFEYKVNKQDIFNILIHLNCINAPRLRFVSYSSKQYLTRGDLNSMATNFYV